MADRPKYLEILGVPNPVDPGGDVSLTEEERAAFRQRDMMDYLTSSPQQNAKQRYDEWLGQNKWKRTGKGILDAIAVGMSSFGNKGGPPSYKGKYRQLLEDEHEEYARKAPLFQRDLAVGQATEQRREAAHLQSQAAREKLEGQLSMFEAGLAAKAPLAQAQTDKINAERKRLMAQIDIIGLEGVKKGLENAYMAAHGEKMGTTPGSVLDARATATDKDVFDGKALSAFIKNSFNGGRGSVSSTTRETREQVTDPLTGITSWQQGAPLTSKTERSGRGGGVDPQFQKLLESRVLQHPMFGGTGSFAATPGGSAPAPASPLAPARVTGRPASIAPSALSSRWWEVPIPKGTMDRTTREQHTGKQKTFASLSKITNIYNDALKTSGIANMGTGPLNNNDKMLLARRLFDSIEPMEAQLRTALASIQAKELLEFTGKVANERDRKLINSMVPTSGDADEELLTKTMFFRLAAEYERFLNGDVIQNRPSMKPELHKEFDAGILVRQAKKLVERLKAGKPVTENDFNMQRLYMPEARKLGIKW